MRALLGTIALSATVAWFGAFGAPAGAQPSVRCTSARACMTRARALERRPPPSRDDALVRAHFARACELGSADGCVEAGFLAETRAHDLVEARRHYEAGCTAGGGLACRNLAVLLLTDEPNRADELFDRACTDGIALACDDLALRLASREDEAAQARAAQLLERACRADEPRACAHLGAVLVHGGLGLSADEARGEALLDAACGRGVGEACFDLARLVEERSRDDSSEVRVASLYLRACEGGDAEACANYGVMLEHGRGGLAASPEGAVAYYRRACDGGALSGCFDLAAHLERSAESDPSVAEEADALLRRACDGGVSRACSLLAFRADPVQALTLHDRACTLGEVVSCDELGELLSGFSSGTHDLTRAAHAFERACLGGVPSGCAHYGHALRRGSGVERDPRAALRMLAHSCHGGSEEGCIEFAEMIMRGEGVTADPVRGRAVLEAACRGGGERACARLRMGRR